MSDYPSFLQVGTEISAKFKGAFCEAKIKKASRCLKCRVVYKDVQIPSCVIEESSIRGTIKIGVSVEAPHPESKHLVPATIQQIKDCSTYTVVFDDGDEKVLRRSQMCLKGGRHFDESESLDKMPLTKPEQFGAPVRSKSNKKQKASDDDVSDNSDCGSSSSVEKKSTLERRTTRQTPVPAVRVKSADVGRVFCIFDESGEKKRWYPGLAVNPACQPSVKIKTRDELLVRNFKDGKFQIVSRSSAQEFNVEKAKKNDNASLKNAVDKAVLYMEKGDLPASWDREALVGDAHAESTSSDDEASSEEESTSAESPESKDRFVAQLYKYMDENGTPINKAPILAQRDLDLYRLFESVRKLGGYNRVCLKNEWKTILKKLKLEGLPGATAQAVKSAYNKYLYHFEAFYRRTTSPGNEPMSRRDKMAAAKMSRINEEQEKLAKRANKGTRKLSMEVDHTPTSSQEVSSETSTPIAGESVGEASGETIEGQFAVGQKLRVQYGSGPQIKIYVAKVVKLEEGNKYLVHYLGWNTRYDEIIDPGRVIEVVDDEGADLTEQSASPGSQGSTPRQKFGGGRGGHKFGSGSRLSQGTDGRKRNLSGGSTHSLPLERSGSVDEAPPEAQAPVKEKMAKKNNQKVAKSETSAQKVEERRSASVTPSPTPLVSEDVQKKRKRSAVKKEEEEEQEEEEANESDDSSSAAVRRVSKRLRGEKPRMEKEVDNFGKTKGGGGGSNQDDEERDEDDEEGKRKVGGGEVSKAMEEVKEEECTEEEICRKSVEKLVEMAEIEHKRGENEGQVEEVMKLENPKEKEKSPSPSNEVDEEEEKKEATPPTKEKEVPKKSAAVVLKKAKPKRRRRNYSQMVTDHRKSSKSTPKKDKDADSDPDAKVENSPKDPNGMHALRHKVQMEIDQDPNYKPFYTFNVVDESLEGDKKVQVLQQRIIDIKEAYAQVKAEWAYLERKRKKLVEKKRKQALKGKQKTSVVENVNIEEAATVGGGDSVKNTPEST